MVHKAIDRGEVKMVEVFEHAMDMLLPEDEMARMRPSDETSMNNDH